MADTKLSALTELAAEPATTDELVLVDKSDTTQAASGTTKRITYTNLVSGVDARLDKLERNLFYPENYGAQADGVIVDDAAITASDATLTSATASFTADDVGKSIVVTGAGASGANLATTIASHTNSTTVELTASAGTTVSDARAVYGTDDTEALQDAIDAAIAAGGGIIQLAEAIYTVSSAPRTDRDGNCILSLHDTQESMIPIAIRGYGGIRGDGVYADDTNVPASVIAALRVGDAYSGTNGPPSVLGAATDEQVDFGSLPALTPFRTIGPVKGSDFAVWVPLDPGIAGIDAISFGGAEFFNVSVFAGRGGDATAVPTNEHAFGFRWPTQWHSVTNVAYSCHAFQFYVGHAFWNAAYHIAQHSWSYKCVIGYGAEAGDTVLALDPAWAGACNYMVAGWDPTSGVVDVPGTVVFAQSTLQTDAAGSPFGVTSTIKDTNNNCYGELFHGFFNGLSYGSTATVEGGQNLRYLLSRDSTPNVSSASTITVPPYTDVVKVTGTTTITNVTASYAKRRVTLVFSSTAQVTDGGNLRLRGNLSGAADRVLTLVCDGTDWWEAARSYNNASDMAAYTLSNVTTDRTFNANSYTMDELADVLGTLIGDLQARGIVG